MAGRPSFANVNTNDTDGMMLTSCTVVYVKTAIVKVRVSSLVGNTAKALTSMNVQTIFSSPNLQSSRQCSTITHAIHGASPREIPANSKLQPQQWGSLRAVQGYIKGGKARGSRVQVDRRRRRRRRRRRSATCLTASRLVVRAVVGFMGGG
ncbi:hypothetical protein CCUS01_05968 [Colletotrichum cuscutae]|uniref:Uncharacterized protein n=1 Tax=Colletotrichum cuscutae TaxID=1209917 RepID=A0AAI9Y3F4_9PEZI|nr:hypothetical protein CCUS01_05968 [Colletotrichum cuscutae]